MKVIFIEIYYKNWDKIDNGVVYEVKNVSYHLYTDELKENYVKVELFSFK